MQKWYALAAAGLLLFGASAVKAAPVIVTYGIGPCAACVQYAGFPVPLVSTVGVTDGSLTVAFTGGSLAPGGTLGAFGQVVALGLNFTTPIPTGILTNVVPGVLAGGGMGVANLGAGNFGGSGMTSIPANALGTGLPPYNQVGNAALQWQVAGTALFNLLGAGVQTIGPGIPVLGTISNQWTLVAPLVGQEISRVPEPATGTMLLVGLAGLAGLGGAARRARR